MALEYAHSIETIIKRLNVAHNPNIAKIRAKFFEEENSFFRQHICNQKVLVAGSGLGHDSFELASYNQQVVSIELLKPLVKIAQQRAEELGLHNIKFMEGDFTQLSFQDKFFDAAILNMGTIGNFDNKAQVIKELLRVSKAVYLDFYPPIPENLKKRLAMYKEEGWLNVKIQGTTIVSDDGLDSISISKEELSKIINSIGATAKYHLLCEFAIMAEIR